MFHIRSAKYDDCDAIVEFQIQMAKESEGIDLDRNILNDGVKSVFNDPQKGHYYVVEENEKVVGSMLTTFEWSDWRNQYIYWLQSVYLIPEYRGKRIFSRMFDHIRQKVVNDVNVAGIRLYVDRRNQHAIGVYQSVGMNGDHYKTFEWMKDSK